MLRDRHLRVPLVLGALDPRGPGERDREEEREGGEQEPDPAVRAPVFHRSPSRRRSSSAGRRLAGRARLWRPLRSARWQTRSRAASGAARCRLQLRPLPAEPVELHVELEDEDVDRHDAGEQHADEDDPGHPPANGARARTDAAGARRAFGATGASAPDVLSAQRVPRRSRTSGLHRNAQAGRGGAGVETDLGR